jgi:hypothetical protein
MSLSNSLKSRWKPEHEKHGIVAAMRPHFHRALDIREQLQAKKAALATDNHLSEHGRRQVLRDFAATDAARTVARATRALSKAQDKVREQRMALTPAVKDKGNVANALLRQEIRASLRGKTPGQLATLLFDPSADPLMIEAAFEAPLFLTGLTAEMKDHLLEAVVARTKGPQVEALAQTAESLETVAAAVRVATDTLQEAAGCETPAAFEAWLSKAAPLDQAELAAEKVAYAKLEADLIALNAGNLPLAARMTLVESLLATNTDELAGKARDAA